MQIAVEQAVKHRLAWIDNARVLAIYGVIGIHACARHVMQDRTGSADWWLANLMDSSLRWAAPVFIIISGYTLMRSTDESDTMNVFTKRMKRLLVPFIFWNALYILLYLAASLKNNYPLRLSELTVTIVTGRHYAHLWFAYVIIGLYLISPFLVALIRECSRQQVVLLLAVTLAASWAQAIFTYTVADEGDPLLLTLFVRYIPYFLAGAMLSSYGWVSRKLGAVFPITIMSIAALVFSAGRAYGMPSAIYFYDYNTPLVFVMALSFFMLVRGIDKPLFGKLTPVISNSTLGIYFSHPIFAKLIDVIWGSYLTAAIINMVAMTVLPAAIATIFVVAMNRLPVFKALV